MAQVERARMLDIDDMDRRQTEQWQQRIVTAEENDLWTEYLDAMVLDDRVAGPLEEAGVDDAGGRGLGAIG